MRIAWLTSTSRAIAAVTLLMLCREAGCQEFTRWGTSFYSQSDFAGTNHTGKIGEWGQAMEAAGFGKLTMTPSGWAYGEYVIKLYSSSEATGQMSKSVGCSLPAALGLDVDYWIEGTKKHTEFSDIAAFYALMVHEAAHVRMKSYWAVIGGHCDSLPEQQQTACQGALDFVHDCYIQKLASPGGGGEEKAPDKTDECSEVYAESEEAFSLCKKACEKDENNEFVFTQSERDELISMAGKSANGACIKNSLCEGILASCISGCIAAGKSEVHCNAGLPYPSDGESAGDVPPGSCIGLTSDWECDCNEDEG